MTSVGRNLPKAVRTAESGSRRRGNDVLSRSFPPPTTLAAPVLIAPETK
jgi:hypothetical protein